MDACQKYGRNSSAFDRVCEEAVESVTNPQPLYDVILVDEAQDFSKYFLQMCYMSLPHECKLRSNGMPVPLLRNGYSIFNGTKYR